ncbi:MAG: hypothetical protein JWR36_2489 [Glaciihabitans sp.]|jgi:uncharacterized membrane protein YkvA (DUF1232 family)|nr:hypothetical protein [Glaciihabitans sp.]MDQ1571315.1 hypothetical protein [Actinomycetota bacterium]
MTEWWQVALSVAGGLLILWAALAVVLLVEQRKHPDGASLRDLLRLAPDVARLLKRLASDRSVPLAVRIMLLALLVYLLSPIDLIPDFIPVLGYADDALVVAIALRFATRRAGTAAIQQHWPGTPEGLAALLRLAGLTEHSPAQTRPDDGM